MKRNILIALLSVGTVGGFGAGFASLHHHHRHRRAHFERHVAQVCLEAARELEADEARHAPPPEARPPHAHGEERARRGRRHRRPHHPPPHGRHPRHPPPDRRPAPPAPGE